MDSDGEEEICELVDVLDMFIDSDFGDKGTLSKEVL